MRNEKMKTVYLINEIVLFNPDTYSLTPKKSFPGGKITLHAPASECLRILLNQPHQPVAQKQLFEEVWQRKGIVVSTNTLYQSIASIRKGLKAAGLEEDIIRTLPRQGFQCNARVETGDIETFFPPVMEAEKTAPLVTEPGAEKKRPSRHLPGYATLLSGAISLTLVGCLIYWLQHSELPNQPEYYPAGQIERCTLYSSWSGKEYSQSVFKELRQRYPIDCQNNHLAWLTINRLQLKSSLLLCDKQIENEKAKCTTIIFKDEDRDEHQ